MSEKLRVCFGCGEEHTNESGLCEDCEAVRERILRKRGQAPEEKNQEARVSRSLIRGIVQTLGILIAFIMM